MVKSARNYAPAHRSMANPNAAVFLLRVRHLHHLTQKQAAKRAGISVGMLSMLEHGKRRPSVVTAAMLIDVYKIPADAAGVLWDEALPGVGNDSPYKRRRNCARSCAGCETR
jgi:transcriptional regulator with XRE-family HTH domain